MLNFLPISLSNEWQSTKKKATHLVYFRLEKTGTGRYNILNRMGIYIPIKLQNVASLDDCNSLE